MDGVEYIPLDQVKRMEADVLILNTSGGDLDLSPALNLEVDAALKIVWAQGVSKPKGLENTKYDHLYAVSNFIADVVKNVWGVEEKRIFVTYNAFEEELFSKAEQSNPSRDPHRLVYFSHPSKGLETAVRIVERLRRHNRVFRLNVFGGHRLWGEKEAGIPEVEGVDFGGLAGQRKLAMELLKSTYSIHLQSRDEPCPLSAVEALRAGCVILASPVGSYPELIRSGQNGYLIEGDHESDMVADQAADLILSLQRDRHHLQEIRWNARWTTWESLTQARAWTGQWAWCLDGGGENRTTRLNQGGCSRCGGDYLYLDDGYHCIRCSKYDARPLIKQPAPSAMKGDRR